MFESIINGDDFIVCAFFSLCKSDVFILYNYLCINAVFKSFTQYHVDISGNLVNFNNIIYILHKYAS